MFFRYSTNRETTEKFVSENIAGESGLESVNVDPLEKKAFKSCDTTSIVFIPTYPSLRIYWQLH